MASSSNIKAGSAYVELQAAWIDYVRSLNVIALGETTDLGEFLFGCERASLEVYCPILQELQHGQCFYCDGELRGRGEVDHFIPWSRYPLDLGHNFVLAHRTCNADKSNHLAAERHLRAWVQRNQEQDAVLRGFFGENRLPADLSSSESAARWAYSQTASISGLVWLRSDELTQLGEEWRGLLLRR